VSVCREEHFNVELNVCGGEKLHIILVWLQLY